VAERTGIEITELTGSGAEKYLHLEKKLNGQIFGQQTAIQTVTSRLKLAATGLRDEEKPMGVFLFLGPTGVGKTYLAELIAENLFGSKQYLIRIDMSEYMEQHNVARLIGSPPGYIGHNEEGQLTGALKQKPYSLVLLDEVDKANPKVWDIFLQVFDDGRLTDGKGQTVDASHAIFIMTSNIGVGNESKQNIGFIRKNEGIERNQSQYFTAIKENFRPEFINRIDEIVIFNSLDVQNIESIAKMEIELISKRLAERSIEFTLQNDVLGHLVKIGYSQDFGARHMRRTIETLIGKPLSEFLLQNKTKDGDQIIVTFNDNEVVIGNVLVRS